MAVDADGTKVVYTDATPSGREVYRYDQGTGVSTLLTSSGGDGSTPATGDSGSVAISADGSYVAFTSSASDLDASGAAAASVPQVYVAHVAGDGSITLTRLPVPAAATDGASSVAISGDGSRIAFAGNAGASGTGSAYVDDWQSTGATPRPVDVTPSDASTKTVVDQVTLSSDGSTLAAVVEDGTTSQPDGARVVLADLGSATTATMPGTEADRTSPVALTGDGNLVLAAPAAAQFAGPDAGYLITWRWRRSGAAPHQIGSNGYSYYERPSISADGHLVAYSMKYSDKDGYLVQVGQYPQAAYPAVTVSGDAGDYPSPTTGFGTDPALARSLPILSGDGVHVVFRSNSAELPDPPASGKTTLYLATLNDSQPPQLGPGGVSAGNVQTDSAQLSFPSATDDLFVVGSSLSDNGTPVSGYDGGSSYTVTGLTPGTKHVFTYTVSDQSGHTASDSATVWTAQAPVDGSFDATMISALPARASGLGIQVDENAASPVISADGRYVAYVGAVFTGYDSNGDPVDLDGNPMPDTSSAPQPDDQLYLTDTLTGTTTLVTHQAGGSAAASAPAPSSIAISSDGRYLAYVATGTDLTAGVTGTDPHAYVYDRAADTSTVVPTQYPLASPGSGGGVFAAYAVSSSGQSVSPMLALSADGTRLVALTYDPSAYAYAEVTDWQGGGTRAIPVQWNSFSAVALSPDGATLAVSGRSPDGPEVLVLDAATARTLADLFLTSAQPVGFGADGTLLLDATGPFSGAPLALEWSADHPDQLVAIGGPEPAQLAADGVHVTQSAWDNSIKWSHVYLDALPDGVPQQVSTGEEPTLSRDGSAVAYIDEVDTADGWHYSVFVAHAHDTAAPTWAGGAQLTVSDVTTTSMHLAWPAASDDNAVASYVLTQDGNPLATVDASTRSYDVTGLTAGTAYHFAIVAKDAAGNTSPALTADATTLSAGITPGADPLLATAKHGGLVMLSWDPAGGTITGYRVMRDGGTGFALVADVSPGTTRYTDTGLLASSNYTYRVDLLGASGAAGPWTKTAAVTTPGLTISKATASIPRLDGTDIAPLGGEVHLRVVGEPNRSASARVVYSLPVGSGTNPQHGSADVALSEDPANPGSYTGTWAIPEGAAVLDSVTGVLSDGDPAHDVTAAAAGLPVQDSGAIAVTVDAPPAGSLAGSTLWIDHSPVAVDGPGTYTLPVPEGAGYPISMDTKSETDVASATADVVAGRTATVEITPSLHASLVVSIAKPYGGYLFCPSNVSVTLVDDAGTQLGEQQTDCYTRTVTFSGLPVGDHVTATSTLRNMNDPVLATVHDSLTLADGENDLTLTHTALPGATAAGTITEKVGSDVRPLNKALIVATEHVDGRDWTFRTSADSNGQYSLGMFAGTASVTVSYAGSYLFPDTADLTLGDGATVTHDVQLRQGTLTVHVLPADGLPAGGVTVSESYGYGVDQQTDVPDGQTDATLTGLQDRQFTITVDVHDHTQPVHLHYSTTFTPTSPVSELTVQEQALPTSTLVGTITAAGDPVPGMTVQLSEKADNRSWTYHGITDSDGRYSIAALAGAGTAGATAPTPAGFDLPAGHAVTLPAGGVANSDFQLPRFTTRTVHLNLITTDFGSSPSPQTLDWTTNYHFHTSLRDAENHTYSVHDTVAIPITAASPLTFCAKGYEAGLPNGCVTQSFGDTQSDVTLTLRLAQVAGVTGTIIGADGSPLTGTWTFSARPLDDAARVNGGAFSAFGDGSSLHQGLPAAGKWEIRISSSQGQAGPLDITVAAGHSFDLGDVLLSRSAAVTGDNSVVATPNPVEPGQLLQVEAAFRMSTDVPAASIRLGVPDGTTFATNSVTVDGTPVDASAADAAVTVPLGDLATGTSHVVRYAVTVDDGTNASSLSTPVWLADSGGTLHTVGSATVALIAVSLNAPEHASATTFTVNGTAPAGNDVAVVDAQGDTLGSGTAGPGGLWQAQVQLTDAYAGRTYQLTARTDYAGQPLSATADVGYDPNYLLPTSITVGQPDGRFHSYNPANGVAYFTLVYRPSLPVRVIAAFTDTTRIEHPVAWVGANWAPMTCDATSCTADVTIADRFAGGSGVSVDYHLKPVLEPASTPSQQQVFAAQPGPFADASGTTSSISYDYAGDQSGAPAGQVLVNSITSTGTAAIPGSGVDMNYTVSIAESSTPVGDPVDMAGGGTIYAAHSVSKSADGSVALHLTLYVPADELSAAGGSVRTALRAMGMPRLASMTPDGIITKALGVVVNVGMSLLQGAEGTITSGAQTAWGLIKAFYTPPSKYYDQLHSLQDEIYSAQCLTPEQRQLLLDEVEVAGAQVTLIYAMQALAPVPMFLSGIGEESSIALATLDITGEQAAQGLINYEAGNIVSDTFGQWMQSEVDDTRNDVDTVINDSGCKPPPPPDCPPNSTCPAPKPSGNITPIIDPSGIVTDGTTGDAIDGVTATIQTAPSKDGPWTTWNAADFGQTNPQVTDSTGAFGWDTPIGWYRVQLSKQRYVTGYSQVVHVLPEWTDLNVALQRKVVKLGVSAHPDHPVYGDPITLDVTTTPSEPGQILTVADGGAALGSVTLGSDGTGSIRLTGLHAGEHELTVSYAGDDEHFPSSATVEVAIARAPTRLTIDRIRTLGDLLAFLHGRTVTAHLSRADDGAPLAGMPVVLSTRKGEICAGTTDATGTLSCTVPVRMTGLVLLGWVRASFAGTADYLPSRYGPEHHRHGHGHGHGGRGRPWRE